MYVELGFLLMWLSTNGSAGLCSAGLASRQVRPRVALVFILGTAANDNE